MVTAQTTEAIVETTIEAITEVAKVTKCLPRTLNLPTEEETTPKEEEDKTEEVEVAITPKEEEDQIQALCKECSANSVAKKDTGKTNVTQKSTAKNARIKNLTQYLKTKMSNNLSMTRMTTKPMKNSLVSTMLKSLVSTMLSQQKTKKWFS